MKYGALRNHIGGDFVATHRARPFLDAYNPSSRDVISKVPLSQTDEVDAAVSSAGAAFPAWSATPIKERVQVFDRYKALLERHIDELAALVTEENGKITSEARAEVLKAAESKFGVGDITGRGSIEFWTQAKKMTTKWNREPGVNWMS